MDIIDLCSDVDEEDIEIEVKISLPGEEGKGGERRAVGAEISSAEGSSMEVDSKEDVKEEDKRAYGKASRRKRKRHTEDRRHTSAPTRVAAYFEDHFDMEKLLPYCLQTVDIRVQAQARSIYLNSTFIEREKVGSLSVGYKIANQAHSSRLSSLSQLNYQKTKFLREHCAPGDYVDVDIVNAHPTIFRDVIKATGLNASLLDEYVERRDELIGVCSATGYGIDRSTVKRLFIALFNMGTSESVRTVYRDADGYFSARDYDDSIRRRAEYMDRHKHMFSGRAYATRTPDDDTVLLDRGYDIAKKRVECDSACLRQVSPGGGVCQIRFPQIVEGFIDRFEDPVNGYKSLITQYRSRMQMNARALDRKAYSLFNDRLLRLSQFTSYLYQYLEASILRLLVEGFYRMGLGEPKNACSLIYDGFMARSSLLKGMDTAGQQAVLDTLVEEYVLKDSRFGRDSVWGVSTIRLSIKPITPSPRSASVHDSICSGVRGSTSEMRAALTSDDDFLKQAEHVRQVRLILGGDAFLYLLTRPVEESRTPIKEIRARMWKEGTLWKKDAPPNERARRIDRFRDKYAGDSSERARLDQNIELHQQLLLVEEDEKKKREEKKEKAGKPPDPWVHNLIVTDASACLRCKQRIAGSPLFVVRVIIESNGTMFVNSDGTCSSCYDDNLKGSYILGHLDQYRPYVKAPIREYVQKNYGPGYDDIAFRIHEGKGRRELEKIEFDDIKADIHIDSGFFIVVSAPMGAGKTELLPGVFRHFQEQGVYDNMRILFITTRVSLMNRLVGVIGGDSGFGFERRLTLRDSPRAISQNIEARKAIHQFEMLVHHAKYIQQQEVEAGKQPTFFRRIRRFDKSLPIYRDFVVIDEFCALVCNNLTMTQSSDMSAWFEMVAVNYSSSLVRGGDDEKEDTYTRWVGSTRATKRSRDEMKLEENFFVFLYLCVTAKYLLISDADTLHHPVATFVLSAVQRLREQVRNAESAPPIVVHHYEYIGCHTPFYVIDETLCLGKIYETFFEKKRVAVFFTSLTVMNWFRASLQQGLLEYCRLYGADERILDSFVEHRAEQELCFHRETSDDTLRLWEDADKPGGALTQARFILYTTKLSVGMSMTTKIDLFVTWCKNNHLAAHDIFQPSHRFRNRGLSLMVFPQSDKRIHKTATHFDDREDARHRFIDLFDRVAMANGAGDEKDDEDDEDDETGERPVKRRKVHEKASTLWPRQMRMHVEKGTYFHTAPFANLVQLFQYFNVPILRWDPSFSNRHVNIDLIENSLQMMPEHLDPLYQLMYNSIDQHDMSVYLRMLYNEQAYEHDLDKLFIAKDVQRRVDDFGTLPFCYPVDADDNTNERVTLGDVDVDDEKRYTHVHQQLIRIDRLLKRPGEVSSDPDSEPASREGMCEYWARLGASRKQAGGEHFELPSPSLSSAMRCYLLVSVHNPELLPYYNRPGIHSFMFRYMDKVLERIQECKKWCRYLYLLKETRLPRMNLVEYKNPRRPFTHTQPSELFTLLSMERFSGWRMLCETMMEQTGDEDERRYVLRTGEEAFKLHPLFHHLRRSDIDIMCTTIRYSSYTHRERQKHLVECLKKVVGFFGLTITKKGKSAETKKNPDPDTMYIRPMCTNLAYVLFERRRPGGIWYTAESKEKGAKDAPQALIPVELSELYARFSKNKHGEVREVIAEWDMTIRQFSDD